MTTLELEFRSATQVGVSFPKRQIELIVMPYEREAHVPYRGRWIDEIVSRGAFEGIDADRRRITVYRGHPAPPRVDDKVVGKATKFHPSREEGLVAELQIARTPDGEETLELASEGLLDASAGFGVPDGGESWPRRSLRRLTRVWLDHIAMVPNPAYSGTSVLAVREERPLVPTGARPNLEIVRGWRLADEYAILEGRSH